MEKQVKVLNARYRLSVFLITLLISVVIMRLHDALNRRCFSSCTSKGSILISMSGLSGSLLHLWENTEIFFQSFF